MPFKVVARSPDDNYIFTIFELVAMRPKVDTLNLPQHAEGPVGLHMWEFDSVGVGT